jgi:hypothetical protein
MKTLKVEDVYLMEYETFEDVAFGVPRFIEAYNERRLHSALGYLSPPVRRSQRPRPCQNRRVIVSTRRGAFQIRDLSSTPIDTFRGADYRMVNVYIFCSKP